MRLPRFRTLLAALLVAAFTFLALVVLNALARRETGTEALATIDRIYAHDEWNVYRLKAGAAIDLPVGVYGPFLERWRRSGAIYHVAINDDGFRGDRIPRERTPGAWRVAFVGDSSTFGWDVEADQTFAARAGALLSTGGRRVEVLSAGVPGYSTHQGLSYLERFVLPYRPDAIVLSFSRNDEMDVTFGKAYGDVPRSDSEYMPRDRGPDAFLRLPPAPRPDLLTRLRTTDLYRFIRAKIVARTQQDSRGQEGERPIAIKRRVAPEEYRANWNALIDAATRVGASVVVLNVGSTTKEYPAIAREVAAARGVPFVDALPVFEARLAEMRAAPEFARDREYYARCVGPELFGAPEFSWIVYTTDLAHPNAIGHAILARELAKTLAPLLDARR
jgi:lysophospholipase L1-like esterase